MNFVESELVSNARHFTVQEWPTTAAATTMTTTMVLLFCFTLTFDARVKKKQLKKNIQSTRNISDPVNFRFIFISFSFLLSFSFSADFFPNLFCVRFDKRTAQQRMYISLKIIQTHNQHKQSTQLTHRIHQKIKLISFSFSFYPNFFLVWKHNSRFVQ
jgi:hypothetical protein